MFGPIEEEILVSDWGLAIESLFGNHVPGHVLAEQGEDIDDTDAYYQLTHYMASFWPYSEDGRLIGEHIYEDAGSRTIHRLEPGQVVTPARASELLSPMLDLTPAVHV